MSGRQNADSKNEGQSIKKAEKILKSSNTETLKFHDEHRRSDKFTANSITDIVLQPRILLKNGKKRGFYNEPKPSQAECDRQSRCSQMANGRISLRSNEPRSPTDPTRTTPPGRFRAARRTACYALLTTTLAAYAAGGAFLFRHLDDLVATRDRHQGAALSRMKNDTAVLLATELRLVVPHESTWAKKVYQYLDLYERNLLGSMGRGFDRGRPGRGRGFGTSLLVSFSLVTATGSGVMQPNSDLERLAIVLFTLLGVPLTLSWLVTTGHYLSVGLAEIFGLACSSSPPDAEVAERPPRSSAFKRYLSFGKGRTGVVLPVKEGNPRSGARFGFRKIDKVSPSGVDPDSVPNGKPAKTGWKADSAETGPQTARIGGKSNSILRVNLGETDGWKGHSAATGQRIGENSDSIPNGNLGQTGWKALSAATGQRIGENSDAVPNGNLEDTRWKAGSDATGYRPEEEGRNADSMTKESLENACWNVDSESTELLAEKDIGITDSIPNGNLEAILWKTNPDATEQLTEAIGNSGRDLEENLEEISWEADSDASVKHLTKNADPISSAMLADVLESQRYSRVITEHLEMQHSATLNQQRTGDSASALAFAILLFVVYFAFGSATISVLEEWDLTEALFMNFLMFSTLGPGALEREEEVRLKSSPYYLSFLVLGYCMLFMIFDLIYHLVCRCTTRTLTLS